MKSLLLAAAAFALSPAAHGDLLRIPVPGLIAISGLIPSPLASRDYSFGWPVGEDSIFSAAAALTPPTSSFLATGFEPDLVVRDDSRPLVSTLLGMTLFMPEPPAVAMLGLGLAFLIVGKRKKRDLRRQRHLSELRRRVKTEQRMMAA